MTYEEAKANLERLYPYLNEEGKRTLDLAIEALEKQIPKKPRSGSWKYCPDCDIYFTILSQDGEKYRYCYNCGQAIDWGDE